MGIAETDVARHAELRKRLAAKLKREIIRGCTKCNGGWLEIWNEPDDDALAPSRLEACQCRRHVRRLLKLAEAGVPRELWLADEIDPDHNEGPFAELAEYAANLDEAFEHGRGFLLAGENGTGKSSSAAIAVIAALRAGHTAAFIDFRDLVDGWRRAFRDVELLRHLDERCSRDLVVLDEVGKEHWGNDDGSFVLSRFDSLLRLRRGEFLPTILVTNLDPTAMVKRYGESFGSLLADRFKLLSYEPGDFRVSRASWGAITSSTDALKRGE